MTKNNIAISVSGVSKSFKLPHEKQGSVKGAFVNIFRLKRNKVYEKQNVLEDISFDIKKGEFFGIVGRNGSGKSTLLKILAGIYAPESGNVHINGKLTPFIELGVGFNMELTGRENVFLNGALLGFSRKEMEVMYEDIVEFAELERFMDQKLKNYSSGMQVRLAFSIAIQAQSDILVLDEVLAVGDYNFQQKCFDYFKQLKRLKKTVVLVSHDPNALQMFCENAILIEKGKIKIKSSINDVLKQYSLQNQSDREKENINDKAIKKTLHSEGDRSAEFKNVTLHKSDKKSSRSFAPKESITVTYEVLFNKDVVNPVFGLTVQDAAGGQPIFATNTMDLELKTGQFRMGETKIISFTFPNNLNDGMYYVSGAIASSDRSRLYSRFINCASFSSVGWNTTARSRVYQDYLFDIQSK